MKLRNIGIATALILMGSNAMASQSLHEALANGTFKGEIKALYLAGDDTDVAAAKASDDRNSASIAIEANYISGDFYGFRLGLSAQSGYDLKAHEKDGGSEDDTRNTITSTEIHEAYLDYAFNESSIRVGRQIIKTPLLMNSSAFPLKDSFDAVTFNTKLIPDTEIKFSYVNNWNKRYGSDSNGSVVQDDKEYDDGLFSLYLKNKSIKNLTLDGQYLTTDEEGSNGDPSVMTTDGYDEYFVRANYKINTEIPLTLGGLYAGADFDKTTEEDVSLFGINLGANINGVKLSAAYTSVDDDNDFPGALGHVPDVLLYTNGLINKSIYAGVDAYSLQAMYNFGIKSFNSRLKYIHFDQSDKGISNSVRNIDEADEINLDLKYSFGGKFKGLSTRLFMGYASYDQNVDEDTNLYGKLYLTYKF